MCENLPNPLKFFFAHSTQVQDRQGRPTAWIQPVCRNIAHSSGEKPNDIETDGFGEDVNIATKAYVCLLCPLFKMR